MELKMLWKIPGSIILLALICAFLLVALPPFMVLTLLWLPLAISGAVSCQPPIFLVFDAIGAVFDWWADL